MEFKCTCDYWTSKGIAHVLCNFCKQQRDAEQRRAEHYAFEIDRSDEGLPPFNHNLVR